jgi:HlyD family secretion protein
MPPAKQLPPGRRSWFGRLVLFLIVAGVAVGGLYYYQSRSAKAAATTQPSQATAVVAKGNIFQAVASTGRVVSNLDVEIKCKASGQIIELPYDVSQAVKKDALIVQVDPIDQQRAVRQAEVALAQSQAKLAQAKQNLTIAEQTLANNREKVAAQIRSAEAAASDARDKAKRRRELFEQKLTSPEELQTTETAVTTAEAALRNAQLAKDDLKTQELGLDVKREDVKLSEAQVENDQIALTNMKQRLADTTVTAPVDGVVSVLNVQRGQIIASGVTNVGGGTPVMILSDLSRIFVLASVDESDIGKVQLDQAVNVTADAFPGTRFRGKVVRIATKGVNISNVVTFEVKVEVVSENKSLLKPEMTANVSIVSASKQDVLTVPANALTRKQGKTFATVQKQGGAAEERAVETGLTDGQNWEVLSGLSEGETVVFKKDEPQSRWREGGGGGGGRPPGGPMGGFPGGGGGRR